MKRYLAFISLMLLGIPFFTSAQIRKIPSEVTESFRQKYPLAENVEWRDKLTGFTAAFALNDSSYVASYNNEGDWEQTELEISQESLPEVIKDSFGKSKYADWEIEHVYRIELPDNILQYRIQVMKTDIRKRNLFFNVKGRMLRDKITL